MVDYPPLKGNGTFYNSTRKMNLFRKKQPTLHSLESQSSKHFDYVVIGAGSAGCVVASRLAERNPNITVALIEAGDRATELEASMPIAAGKLQHTKRDWAYKCEPSQNAAKGLVNQQVSWPAGKGLGGTSEITYMAYVRGSQKDYDLWENEYGAKGWSWKDTLPLFIKSERNETLSSGETIEGLTLDEKVHGKDGPVGVSSNPTPCPIPQAFVKGATELGFTQGDYNSGDMENKTSIFQQTISGGRRADVASSYLFNKDRHYPNLTIIVNAEATKLLFNDDKSKVIGADFSSGQSIYASKEVILSCGAVKSPHLLLLSGVGPKEELKENGIECHLDAPQVGKNLEDHFCGLLFCKPAKKDIGATNTARAEGLPGSLPQIFKWMVYGKGLHATSAYDATLFYSTDTFKKQEPAWGPDGQIGILSSPSDATFIETNIGFADETNFLKEYYDNPKAQGAVLLPALLHPYSKGTISLRSNDPLDKPKIDPNYLGDQRDVDCIVAVMKKAVELSETPAMKELYSGVALPSKILEKHEGECTDAFWEEYARTYGSTLYHYTSTCAIGKVVDSSLKVMGIKGLRIADASVFPTSVSGNPNAVCTMVGEKCADIIAKENQWA
jgi:choline dehydrogenase